MRVNNPILSGFYPDPSICRVGEDFYLVNSSFAYFPGVPIFHSRDLVHWEQIGNILDRNSQIPLEGCRHSAGIYAPTIRYQEGMFYMITTNVSGGGNFIVTSKDPAGPWSEPYFLGEEAPGIDPSLFFDEDGRCYYIGTREKTVDSRYYGDNDIWLQEVDLKTMRLTGESVTIWNGAAKDAVWPEGPHLYKVNGYYYLMIAEGGTGPAHSITIARSRSLLGPYESNQNNPIFTHRHLGKNYPVAYAGHGDLVETSDGNWYIVMLASRPLEGHTLMGRETFLAKVVWEDGWPVINPSIGKLEDTFMISLEERRVMPKEPVVHFDEKELPYEFVMLRNPGPDRYSLTEKPGVLRLYLRAETLKEKASPSFIGVRQKHHAYQVNIKMEHNGLLEHESAGLAIVQNNENHIRFEITQKNHGEILQIISCKKGKDSVIAEKDMGQIQGNSTVYMKLVDDGRHISFYIKSKKEWILAAEKIAVDFLSTESAGGFTGCVIGMYASSNENPSSAYVDYHWFSYDELR